MDGGGEREGEAMAVMQRCDEAALDHWLRESLKARYAAIVREPVPLELLQLLWTDAKP